MCHVAILGPTRIPRDRWLLLLWADWEEKREEAIFRWVVW
jgi:hypothetical protein